MKYSKILPMLSLSLLMFSSCQDQIMQWENNPSSVTGAELPLPLVEKISRYEPLKNYTDFVLGNGIGLGLYMTDPAYQKIVNDNFDEVTAGYDMKHGAVVDSKGVLNFTTVDPFVAKIKAAGLSVYGHTLVWHSNQNAIYLNGLIAPTVIPGASIPVDNKLSNGTFDAGTTGWSKWNGAANALNLATSAESYQGNGGLKIINLTDNAGGQWKTQIHSDFITPLTASTLFTVSFMVRSDTPGSIRCSTGGTAQYQGDQATTATWSLVQWKITGSGGETGLNFDLGLKAGTYYIDNVIVTSSAGGTAPPTIVDKTPSEKTTIINAAMQDWISKMVGHYKNDITKWDVVNEPMKEDGTLRDGTESTTATDYFSWVKYLGKDYAVSAFKLARQYGNATDKLFINDYNLEYSLAKCDGIINYVKYIESQGAVVDGIGTQMHISLTSDKAKIVQMFQKLAASGKLIKISEFDISMGTNSPTTVQLAAQAAMYQYVIDTYKQYVPAAQRYGITIWGVSDSVQEHVYWLPDQSPNLWDAKYVRKHAYKGVADGLAGKDVSLGFSGLLQH